MRAASLALVLVLAAPGAAQDLAVHVPTADGTRLAVDVYLPPDRDGRSVPALLELTRYWRGMENPETGERHDALRAVDRHFLAHGYAVVKVDVRGTGASFGTRDAEYGPQEVRDGRDVVEWVVRQPWCDGALGAYGTSYTGTTAELLAACGHPAVRAVIPGWSDYDLYESPARPYGLYASGLIDEWSRMVAALDSDDRRTIGAGVRRVDGDEQRKLVDAAVAEHANNLRVADAARAADFRDQPLREGAPSFAECSVPRWEEELEAGGVPMLVFASWLDAGTAGGAIDRLRQLSNPQKVVILASSHGGAQHASPFRAGGRPTQPVPSFREQLDLRLAFLDHHLKGAQNGVAEWPRVRYFNMGEEALRATDVWPPQGTRRVAWHLHPEGVLAPSAVEEGESSTTYAVDPGVTTGRSNRWATQMGRPVLNLDDRGAMDARMATWTSAPLAADLQLTGTPVVSLDVTSDRADGAFLVYLEVVDPEGRSRYVTEGGLRAIHRGGVHGDPPRPSYAAADAAPLVPGERARLHFTLWPTSVLARRGERLRIALAGADAGTFAPVPGGEPPTLRVHLGGADGSFVELPVVE